MAERKKVYVETTVVSDATALPTNDLSLAGRQIVTRKWWNKAPEYFDLFVSPVVRREAMKGDPSAAARRMEALSDIPSVELTNDAVSLAGGRCWMITNFQHEDTLEEMWRIKRELSTQQGSWAEYAASLMAFQEEERRAGVRYYASATSKAKV